MAAKKKAVRVISPEETDLLLIKPLGAGQEVGRSCIILEFKGKKIMLDCGIHTGLSGIDSLPFIDNIKPDQIDLVLVSHFHLDHCGALPWFLLKTPFKGRCFMTHATKEIYELLLADSIKVGKAGTEQMLYSELDLENSMEVIETVDFHEEKEVNGVRFWCYNAGHVLGAAMFMIEIDGVKVLYTGDFSRQEDRHLMAAEIPNLQPDVLIIESTFGTHIHENRDDREARFTGRVHDIVNRGGKCLIPVFALGRAQELLLILDEYWSNHPELHDIPIYYASSLANKCMYVYQTYVNAMNEKIRQEIAINNPFMFKHISNLKSIDHSEDIGPCVVLATPGLMQSGFSRELFENWCTDPKNGVIIAGYTTEGTLAKHILSEPEEITTRTGENLPLKMSVDYISFAAHTDYQQTSEFIRMLKPPHIVLVHGEPHEMENLKAAIIREYEDDQETNIEVYSPRNTQGVELYFLGEKIATVIGSLANKPPQTGHTLSGVLVKRNFSYHLLAPSDLSKYTDMAINTIIQRLSVPFSGNITVLHFYLNQIFGEVKLIRDFEKFCGKILQVTEGLTVFQEQKALVLEWTASPINDMYADAVIAAILKANKSELTVKALPPAININSMHFTECLIKMLSEMFGKECVRKIVRKKKLTVTVDNKIAVVNIHTLEVKCEEDKVLEQMIHTAVIKLHNCLLHQRVDR